MKQSLLYSPRLRSTICSLASWRLPIYVVLFLLVYWALFLELGRSAMVISMLPLYYFADRYGRWGGLIAAACALPLNLGIFYVLGGPELAAKVDYPFWVSSLTFMPLFYEIGFSRELRTHLEEKLDRLSASVDELRTERDLVRRTSESKDSLLMSISHDLRTPLSAIIHSAQLIEADSGQAESQAGLIKRAGDRVLTLVNDLLRGYRKTTQPPPDPTVAVDLRQQLQETIRLHEPQYLAKGLRLQLHWGEALPIWVETYPKHLSRILANLLGNSLKHTETGGVVVEATRRTREGHEAMLQLAVCDTGIGIPAHEIGPLLAAARDRPRPLSTGDQLSYGLGLGACLRLCDEIGAQLLLQSNEPHGLEAIVRLPLIAAETPAGQDAVTRVEPRTVTADLRVLVVDDDPISAETLAAMLARIGCLVSTAGSGSEAEQAVSGQEFDLAFLDLQLPDTDGKGLAHRLRIAIPAATLVLFSANILLTDLEQWSSPDLDLILSKPISVDDLAEVCVRSASEDGTDGSAPQIEQPDPRQPPVDIAPRHRELLQEYLHECLFAYGRQDIDACAGQAHKITSAAGALQLTELVALARSAEQTARTGSRVALFGALRRLAQGYSRTLDTRV